jgi:hypothetical protein
MSGEYVTRLFPRSARGVFQQNNAPELPVYFWQGAFPMHLKVLSAINKKINGRRISWRIS